MNKNDWLPSFIVGMLIVLVEIGVWMHYTGMDRVASRWMRQLTVTEVAEK